MSNITYAPPNFDHDTLQEVYTASLNHYKSTYTKAEMHKMAKLEEVIEDEIALGLEIKPNEIGEKKKECCASFEERIGHRSEDMPKEGFNGA